MNQLQTILSGIVNGFVSLKDSDLSSEQDISDIDEIIILSKKKIQECQLAK